MTALDPFRGYATARSDLPHAVWVLDAFMSPGSGSPLSTCVGACNRTRPGTASERTTRSTAFGACCAAALTC